ncbi:ABC transporter ATP-binding protein [Streptosporangium sp. NPDC051023]|uniref:ABC transporter ATP-binding protein n=1 Tax=Streptosporangium sp. NPDC051023 TaxID=3155410 RepID=UPI00344EF358
MRLRVDGVCVRLGGTPILHEVSLAAESGQVVGLVGPNGSGKSTLLRTVYRSLRPESGDVRLDGHDVWAWPSRTAARRIAAVLQDDATPPTMTVAEVVELGRTPHHGLFDRNGPGDRAVVREAMKRAGVLALDGRRFGSLSGGERQRVQLARALAQEPRLLILDEPTNHLDIRARFELLDLVRDLGTTTLAVMHELDLAARVCDSLVVLHGGRVAAAGPVLDALTPKVLSRVFGVRARAARDPDGIIRITYAAGPLADGGPVAPRP